MGKNRPLNIQIINDELVITIGTHLLVGASVYNIEDFKVTNIDGFAKDILNELFAEEEDGTTLVHRMFDLAANHAIENGSENVEEVKEEE